jgi:hypothetical protein
MSTTTTITTTLDDVELRQVSLRRGHTTATHPSSHSLYHRHTLGSMHGDESAHVHPDPLFLGTSKKTEDDLQALKKQGSSKKVRQFYRDQNELIDHMLGPLNPLDEEEQEKQLLKVHCWYLCR